MEFLTETLLMAGLLAVLLASLREVPCPAVTTLARYGVFDVRHFRLLTHPNVPLWLAAPWIALDIAVSYWRPRVAAIVGRSDTRLMPGNTVLDREHIPRQGEPAL